MFKIKQFLLVVLLSLCYTVSHAYDFMVDGIAYNINSDNQTVSVTYTKYDPYGNSNYRSVTTVNIPSVVSYNNKQYTITSIGDNSFNRCETLKSVSLPNSVISIEDNAFRSCKALASINFPSSLKTIGYGAFNQCKGLAQIELPNSVTSIGGSAFYEAGLTSINIPNSVNSIGDCAFYACKNLTGSIYIPSSVISIGEGVFSICQQVSSIIVDSNNKFYDSRNNCNAIIETKSNKLIAGCASTKIPSSITEIGYGAFECMGLSGEFIIPNTIVTIGKYGFSGWDNLISLIIPKSVVSIGDYAFYGCDGLTNVTIPSSVTSIGTGAFISCYELTDVYVGNKVPLTIDDYTFDSYGVGVCSNGTLHVPAGCIEVYQSTSGWKNFKNIVDDYKETTDGVKGDVNGDGVVDILDINEIVNIILDD